jgi:hypothetical protein
MTAGPDLLERIDAILAELLELRAQVTASLPPAEVEGLSHRTTNLPDDADDPAEALLDTHSAAWLGGTAR